MNHIEQGWHAFKATLPSSNHMNWDDAIAVHTERDYWESRDKRQYQEERGAKQRRNGGWRKHETRRAR